MAQNGLVASLGLGAVIIYLAANTVLGEDGLVSYVGLQARERALESELASLMAQRDRLEDRAARLRPGTLDRDYLEERARVLLGARRPGEMVLAYFPDEEGEETPAHIQPAAHVSP